MALNTSGCPVQYGLAMGKQMEMRGPKQGDRMFHDARNRPKLLSHVSLQLQ